MGFGGGREVGKFALHEVVSGLPRAFVWRSLLVSYAMDWAAVVDRYQQNVR